jgi:hypothetical protein
MPISAHGFLLRDGVFNKIDFPGAVGTTIVGLNAGDFVGSYVDVLTVLHVISERVAAIVFLLLSCGVVYFAWISPNLRHRSNK